MYCDGTCEHLDEKKHRCKKTGKGLAYMKHRGSVSFTVHEHNGVCEHDEHAAKEREKK